MRGKSATAIVPPKTDVPNMARTLPQQQLSVIDSRWDGVLNRIAALTKEEKVEICGLSNVEGALFLAQPGELNTGTLNATLAEAAGALIRRDKPRDIALGLYVQLNQVDWDAKEIEGSSYKPCKEGSDCRRNESTDTSQRMKAAATVPLVKLALAGNDPSVYATAVYACNGARTGSCASISYGGWAKIEPDNGAVWLMLAKEAAARKDIAARDAALQRAAASAGFDARMPAFLTVFEVDAVKAQSPLVQSLIGITLTGLNAAAAIPQAGALGSLCLRVEAMDEARKSLCDKLANKMLATDDSVLGLIVPTAVGENIGWDAARIQALRDERAVATGLVFDMTFDKNVWSCENLAKSNQWIQNSLSKGERAIAREYIAASGETLSELAKKYRGTYPSLIR